MPRTTRTTTQRGLGWTHQRQRDQLLTRHLDGTPCWWCNKPMYRNPTRNHDGRALHADHTTPRAHGGRIADRLLHGKCNTERGDGTRDHQRPALTGKATTTANTSTLGHRAMPWP